jgi:hypothetical protein
MLLGGLDHVIEFFDGHRRCLDRNNVLSGGECSSGEPRRVARWGTDRDELDRVVVEQIVLACGHEHFRVVLRGPGTMDVVVRRNADQRDFLGFRRHVTDAVRGVPVVQADQANAKFH